MAAPDDASVNKVVADNTFASYNGCVYNALSFPVKSVMVSK
jgi:hypothetical protein